MPTILVGVEDPGAANALAPVVARLVKDRCVKVSCLCHPYAKRTFASFGIPLDDQEPNGPTTQETVARRFASAMPQLVLIGTSENPNSINRLCFVRAKALGIPTVCVLDHWTNYAQRFSGPSPEERLAYLPDLIFVMDEAARESMVAEGIPRERLVVSGHPYLDGYAERLPPFPAEAYERFRESLGIEPGRHLVTFVSETFGWTFDETYRFPPLSSSRERTLIILEHVLAALSELTHTSGARLFLINKLHPKNRPEEFAWLNDLKLPFPVRSVKTLDNVSLLRSSSVVIGMTSMLVVEAACLGIPTLSVVPRALEERFGPNGRQAWEVARTPEELRRQLVALLQASSSGPRLSASPTISEQHRGATERIVRELYALLGATSQCLEATGRSVP